VRQLYQNLKLSAHEIHIIAFEGGKNRKNKAVLKIK